MNRYEISTPPVDVTVPLSVDHVVDVDELGERICAASMHDRRPDPTPVLRAYRRRNDRQACALHLGVAIEAARQLARCFQ